MAEPIAITGVGVLEPAGEGPFAMVEGLDSARHVRERLRRKLDRFSVLGLCAAGMAIETSGLLAGGIPRERVGIFVGNCLGGWGFTEPELRRLHTSGVGAMGPFVATAWFPAAVQGQISLAHGIKGHSKTFSSEIGGLAAIGHAMRAIASGRVDAALCGAVESLDSAYVRAVLGCEPGARFAEGAAFLTLERAGTAAARGVADLAIVTGYAERFAPDPEAMAAQAERTVREAMRADGLVVRRGPDAPRRSFALTGVFEAAHAARRLAEGPVRATDFGGAGSRGFDRMVVQVSGRSGNVAGLGLARAEQQQGKEQAHG